jgi:hypothetical protein
VQPRFVRRRVFRDRQTLGASHKLSRKVTGERNRYYHVINLHGPGDVDDQILAWLTEAYHTAGGTLDAYPREMAAGETPMVPDDVDDLF